jgi:hypothetical protein
LIDTTHLPARSGSTNRRRRRVEPAVGGSSFEPPQL